MNNNILLSGPHEQASGLYRWQVIDARTGKVVRENPVWKKNLILNIGMDGLYSRT